MGWLPDAPAGRQAWLGNEVSACRFSPWRGSEQARTPGRSEIGHARCGPSPRWRRLKQWLVAAVMIGADPHEGSHTAVATGAAVEPLGHLRVRARAAQAGAAGGVGGGLAGADLGGGGRRRPGSAG